MVEICIASQMLSTGMLSLLPTAHEPVKSPVSSSPGGNMGEREEPKYHLQVKAP